MSITEWKFFARARRNGICLRADVICLLSRASPFEIDRGAHLLRFVSLPPLNWIEGESCPEDEICYG